MPAKPSPLDLLTTSELAAFLCVTPSAVRHAARDLGIQPVGKRGREHLWIARPFADTVGGHDRSIRRRHRPTRNKRATLTPEGEDTSVQSPDPH